jgi:hypothetical protein
LDSGGQVDWKTPDLADAPADAAPEVAIWDMTGREAMLLQISSKALWSR